MQMRTHQSCKESALFLLRLGNGLGVLWGCHQNGIPAGRSSPCEIPCAPRLGWFMVHYGGSWKTWGGAPLGLEVGVWLVAEGATREASRVGRRRRVQWPDTLLTRTVEMKWPMWAVEWVPMQRVQRDGIRLHRHGLLSPVMVVLLVLLLPGYACRSCRC